MELEVNASRTVNIGQDYRKTLVLDRSQLVLAIIVLARVVPLVDDVRCCRKMLLVEFAMLLQGVINYDDCAALLMRSANCVDDDSCSCALFSHDNLVLELVVLGLVAR